VSTIELLVNVEVPVAPPINCPMRKLTADHGYVTSMRIGTELG
jgi:hypothetical protein